MRYGVFGQISNQLDIPTLAFWVFVLFFVGLVCWIQRESKREGYPLRASPFTDELMDGFPPPPEEPRSYILNEGGTTQAPHYFEQPPTQARPMHRFDGTPFYPLGNPLLAGIGPGSWVMKRDEPAVNERGELVLQPLRLLPAWSIQKLDADPRGMAVFDWRWNEIGVVTDVWIDRDTKIILLLDVELRNGLNAGRALVPIYHTDIREKSRRVRVPSLWAHQFADVPMPARPDMITGREEERLNAYYSAGFFYRRDALTFPPSGSLP
jgi:photosynthetic reaction center H subunit